LCEIEKEVLFFIEVHKETQHAHFKGVFFLNFQARRKRKEGDINRGGITFNVHSECFYLDKESTEKGKWCKSNHCLQQQRQKVAGFTDLFVKKKKKEERRNKK
jgi:hypothetical protein